MFFAIEVLLDCQAAFEAAIADLSDGLIRRGLRLEPGPNGRVLEGEIEVGRVTAWEPASRVEIDWRPATWQPELAAQIELRFEPIGGGARITVRVSGWDGALQGPGSDLVGWFMGEAVAPVMEAMAPALYGDWLTDRRARRPFGAQARDVYRDPLYHRPNFLALLDVLRLTPEDTLLEVGCGGGALLRDAIRTGCRALAVDHSPDMVSTAREANHNSIEEGRLRVEQADASNLPFADASCSCAVITGVFQFLPEPERALAEIRRVLKPGGRLAMFTSSAALRGTPAAPEPMSSRLRFYEPEELETVARAAGFKQVRVDLPNLYQYARDSGIPEEALPLFANAGAGQLLTARA